MNEPQTQLPSRRRVFERYQSLVLDHRDEAHERSAKSDGISMALRNYHRYRASIELLDGVLRGRIGGEPLSVLDYGAYPGTIDKIIKRIYGDAVEITVAGLGFDAEFVDTCAANAIGVLQCPDVDRDDFDINDVPAPARESYDVFLALNVFEHFLYPTHLLDVANAMLKPRGRMVLTTDNISTLNNALLLFRGESCNEDLRRSHLFFRGSHRPHMRIYSKRELEWLLRHSGFKLLEHRYFDARGKQYRASGRTVERKRRRLTMTIHDGVCRIWPRYRDHHGLVAEKAIPLAELSELRPGPTDSVETWLEIRRWRGLEDPRVR